MTAKSQLQGDTCHMGSPATLHKWTHPTVTPARQASIRFTYPRRMEGWVDLGDQYGLPTKKRSPIQVVHPTPLDQELNLLITCPML